jgi:hypothetical protein
MQSRITRPRNLVPGFGRWQKKTKEPRIIIVYSIHLYVRNPPYYTVIDLERVKTKTPAECVGSCHAATRPAASRVESEPELGTKPPGGPPARGSYTANLVAH